MRTGVRGDTETIAIRLPKKLLVEIDVAANEAQTSRGDFLARMIVDRMRVHANNKKHQDWCAKNLPMPPTPRGAQVILKEGPRPKSWPKEVGNG